MRSLLAVLGLVGIFLTSGPYLAYGGPSNTTQVGLASWYGKLHQGRKTASGERFARGQLTAAHRSFPLGTKVKVTNLRTKQHVVVKINDRGPHGGGKGRIIDLSEAAAQRIGLRERGTERVQVVLVENAS
jgi:rare lipoprotein A